MLESTPRAAAKEVAKVVKVSAVVNATNNFNQDEDTLVLKAITRCQESCRCLLC